MGRDMDENRQGEEGLWQLKIAAEVKCDLAETRRQVRSGG